MAPKSTAAQEVQDSKGKKTKSILSVDKQDEQSVPRLLCALNAIVYRKWSMVKVSAPIPTVKGHASLFFLDQWQIFKKVLGRYLLGTFVFSQPLFPACNVELQMRNHNGIV